MINIGDADMLFNSLHYMIFLPIILLIYYILPIKIRYIWLLIGSYYFYMCWNAKYVLLILSSTIVTYFCGISIEYFKNLNIPESKKIFYKKICLLISLLLNLSILGFFKYSNFITYNLMNVFKYLNIELRIPTFDILLPVGISFYTFQAIGYTIDVYRDEIYAEKNFLKYALFISFFPQLVAGPIERSKNLLKQLTCDVKFNFDYFREGLLLMLWGFFLKIVLADRIAIFVDYVLGDNLPEHKGYVIVVAMILFSIQIYCDFSGYSIIAMGSAKILGIELMENFNAPYFSRSVSEFWRRWHISLSSWFRDYVYIPLGGNRKGKIRKHLNLIITFGISGLWHGASWGYVAWGLLNGVYQIIGNIMKPIKDKINSILGLHTNSFGHKFAQTVTTFALICVSWIFFRADGFKNALDIIRNMLAIHNPWVFSDGTLYSMGLDMKNFHLMILGILLLFIADFVKLYGIKIRFKIMEQDFWFQILFISFSIIGILLFGIWGNNYVTSNFIYFQF